MIYPQNILVDHKLEALTNYHSRKKKKSFDGRDRSECWFLYAGQDRGFGRSFGQEESSNCDSGRKDIRGQKDEGRIAAETI